MSRSDNGGKASRMVQDRNPPTREERLAAKLRENLRRRKARGRALASGEPRRTDDSLPKPPEHG